MKTIPDAAQTAPRLIPVPAWNDHHDWPPPGGMRHLIFNAATNGFHHAFVRVGRRVLVDEQAFFAAVASQNPKPVSQGPRPRSVAVLDNEA